MRRTEPWWTCNVCGEHLIRVGKSKKGRFDVIIDEHRKASCGPIAGCYIVQVEQRKDVK